MRRAFLLLLLATSTLSAQENGCLLEIVAGGGKSFSGDGGPAALAEFDHPRDAVARPDGSIYVADTGNGRVRWISPDGLITTVLRTPEPARIAVSPEGDLFVFDQTQRRIIRRQTHGFVRTVLADAGLGAEVGIDAGPGPTLYLADADNHRVLRLDRSGSVTTVAGNGTAGYAGDGGPAEMAQLSRPTDVALGPDGSLFVADTGGPIRRIWPDGRISAFEIGPILLDFGAYVDFLLGFPGSLDLALELASQRIAVNADGEIALTAIRTFGIPGFVLGLPSRNEEQTPDLTLVAYRISPSRAATRVRGPAVGARAAIDWLPNGKILLGSESLDQLFAFSSNSSFEVVAGVGGAGASGDGGPAATARLRAPQSLAVLSTGEIYVGDEDRVRVIGPDGLVRPSDFSAPGAFLASDADDNLYLADGQTVRKRTPGEAVTTVTDVERCPLESCGTFSGLEDIQNGDRFGRIAVSRSGDLWIEERGGLSSRLRVVESDGNISRPSLPGVILSIFKGSDVHGVGVDAEGGVTLPSRGRIYQSVAGSEDWSEIDGSAGFTGNAVRHTVRDGGGNTYFAAEGRVARLTPEGTLNTVAGPGESSPLVQPEALAFSPEGDLLIADSAAGLVLRLREPEGCDRTVRPQIYSSGVSNVARSGFYPVLLGGFDGRGLYAFELGLGTSSGGGDTAPGMLLSVYGVRLGPEQAVAADYQSMQSVPTELGGITVSIGGKAAGILYASDGQLNLVAPFDLPESGEADLIVTVDGADSEPYRRTLTRSSPGVLVVLNADGTTNSEEQPAAVGDEVSLLVSGLGRPAVEAGALAVSQDVLPWPADELAVAIPNADLDSPELIVRPLWARSRPGEVASIVEVRFRIPEGVAAVSGGVLSILARLPEGETAAATVALPLSATGGFRLFVAQP